MSNTNNFEPFIYGLENHEINYDEELVRLENLLGEVTGASNDDGEEITIYFVDRPQCPAEQESYALPLLIAKGLAHEESVAPADRLGVYWQLIDTQFPEDFKKELFGNQALEKVVRDLLGDLSENETQTIETVKLPWYLKNKSLVLGVGAAAVVAGLFVSGLINESDKTAAEAASLSATATTVVPKLSPTTRAITTVPPSTTTTTSPQPTTTRPAPSTTTPLTTPPTQAPVVAPIEKREVATTRNIIECKDHTRIDPGETLEMYSACGPGITIARLLFINPQITRPEALQVGTYINVFTDTKEAQAMRASKDAAAKAALAQAAAQKAQAACDAIGGKMVNAIVTDPFTLAGWARPAAKGHPDQLKYISDHSIPPLQVGKVVIDQQYCIAPLHK